MSSWEAVWRRSLQPTRFDVAIKEGRIVIISNEPHAPYDRVPLSKDYLLGNIERDDIFLRRARFYERGKIELMLGQPVTALELDQRRVALASGDHVSFDKLLLATGGRPRRLPIPGDDLQGVFYLRNVEDTEAIQQSHRGRHTRRGGRRRLYWLRTGLCVYQIRLAHHRRGTHAGSTQFGDRRRNEPVYRILFAPTGRDRSHGSGAARFEGKTAGDDRRHPYRRTH